MFALLIDIYVRMCQEDGNNGVMAFLTSGVKGRVTFILPIDVDPCILQQKANTGGFSTGTTTILPLPPSHTLIQLNDYRGELL